MAECGEFIVAALLIMVTIVYWYYFLNKPRAPKPKEEQKEQKSKNVDNDELAELEAVMDDKRSADDFDEKNDELVSPLSTISIKRLNSQKLLEIDQNCKYIACLPPGSYNQSSAEATIRDLSDFELTKCDRRNKVITHKWEDKSSLSCPISDDDLAILGLFIGRISSSKPQTTNSPTTEEVRYSGTGTVFAYDTQKHSVFVITCAHNIYSKSYDSKNDKPHTNIQFEQIATFADRKPGIVHTSNIKPENVFKCEYLYEEKDTNDLAILVFEDTKMDEKTDDWYYYYQELCEIFPNRIQLMCSDNIPQNQDKKDAILEYSVYGYPTNFKRNEHGQIVVRDPVSKVKSDESYDGELWGMSAQSFVEEKDSKQKKHQYYVRRNDANDLFVYNAIDTQPGQSGSAIFVTLPNGAFGIVGIHTEGERGCYNSGVALNAQKIEWIKQQNTYLSQSLQHIFVWKPFQPVRLEVRGDWYSAEIETIDQMSNEMTLRYWGERSSTTQQLTLSCFSNRVRAVKNEPESRDKWQKGSKIEYWVIQPDQEPYWEGQHAEIDSVNEQGQLKAKYKILTAVSFDSTNRSVSGQAETTWTSYFSGRKSRADSRLRPHFYDAEFADESKFAENNKITPKPPHLIFEEIKIDSSQQLFTSCIGRVKAIWKEEKDESECTGTIFHTNSGNCHVITTAHHIFRSRTDVAKEVWFKDFKCRKYQFHEKYTFELGCRYDIAILTFECKLEKVVELAMVKNLNTNFVNIGVYGMFKDSFFGGKVRSNSAIGKYECENKRAELSGSAMILPFDGQQTVMHQMIGMYSVRGNKCWGIFFDDDCSDWILNHKYEDKFC